MATSELASTLRKFIDHVSDQFGEHNHQLTVNDLRLGVLHERLSEESDWQNRDLDIVEVHAAQFESSESMENVLVVASESEPVIDCTLVSSICSPSPVAWM